MHLVTIEINNRDDHLLITYDLKNGVIMLLLLVGLYNALTHLFS